MYRKIAVPVDLEHIGRADKALGVVADLAKHWGSPVEFIGVTGTEPGPVAHNPEEFAQKLDAFAADFANSHGANASATAVTVHDITVDLDKNLIKAIGEAEADLVVMASHKPGLLDHVFAGNAGTLAAELGTSVFVVR